MHCASFVLQGEQALKFLWYMLRTHKPGIPSLHSIKKLELPLSLAAHKVILIYCACRACMVYTASKVTVCVMHVQWNP